MVKYHKIFLVGTRKKNNSINFLARRKNWKNCHFWPPLHKSKLNFLCLSSGPTKFLWINNLIFKQIAMTTRNFKKKIYWLLEVIQNWAWKMIFSPFFLVRTWFLRSMGAVAQNWLLPQKFHKNRNCRVSKSKIIRCLWSVALRARKSGYRLRTFDMYFFDHFLRHPQTCTWIRPFLEWLACPPPFSHLSDLQLQIARTLFSLGTENIWNMRGFF